MSEIVEDVVPPEEVTSQDEPAKGVLSEPKTQDWERDAADPGACPGSGGPSEITEENATSSGRDFMNPLKSEESYMVDPVASGSTLYPDLGNFQNPGASWEPGQSSLTLENVDRVNRLGGQSFVEQSTLNARLAWGNRPITPIKQLATPRTQNLDPVMENADYAGPITRMQHSYLSIPDSPRSRGGRSVESRDTFATMSVKEYRESVIDMSQNPWGPDVQRAVVTHATRSIAPNSRPTTLGRMPATVRKRYKDALTSSSDRVARFGWRLIKNFWTWFAVIAVIAAREGFREETKWKDDGSQTNFDERSRGWSSNYESSDDDDDDVINDDADAAISQGKEKLSAQSFMG